MSQKNEWWFFKSTSRIDKDVQIYHIDVLDYVWRSVIIYF